jgi:hypothetical protein
VIRKAPHARNARHLPWLGDVERSHEHLVEARRRIRANATRSA